MATDSKFDDLNLSKDEIDRFSKALKDEEFRKLFVQYAEEIADPVNKARYEAEISQLENERGMDVKFVHPQTGYVVKTTANGEEKIFINVCKNDHIGKPSSKKESGADGKAGLVWSIPHSFAPPKEDKDKKGGVCKVVDFVVNPDTYRMAETNTRFKQMLHDTAFDGIERQFDMKLDRKNMKYPKMTYMGVASPTVIRTRKEDGDDAPVEKDPEDVMSGFPYPYSDETTAEMMKKKEEEIKKREVEMEKKKGNTKFSKEETEADGYEAPKYNIKHRSNFDLQDFRNAQDAKTDLTPDTLVVDIHLPLLKSAGPIDLDIFEKKLTLQSEVPAKYKLDLELPYPVDENEGSASFDKSKRHLIVTLPVIKPKASPILTKTVDDSEPAAEFVKLQDQTKPLIEVLGSQDSGVDVSEIREEVIDAPVVKPEPKYTLPNYEFSQTDETASFVINVSNIVRDSICKTFMPQAPYGADLKFTTMGSGGFPMHHKLSIRLAEVYTIDLDSCDLRLSEQNAVLVFAKADDSLGDWGSCYIGLHSEKLEEKFFVTAPNLRKKLDAIDREVALRKQANMPTTLTMEHPEVEVTRMDMERLEISIKGCPDQDLVDDEDKSPTIIHSKEIPKLHSILKQRTLSESSCDDALSSSYGRQSSNISTDELTDSEESTESSGGGRRRRKKSVSFSEYVDKATYKSNMSVTTMKASLRSKKRKARKREERIQKKTGRQDRRRRRSSGSFSENSSDEHPGHPDDFEVIEGRDVDVLSDDFEVIDRQEVINQVEDGQVMDDRTLINKEDKCDERTNVDEVVKKKKIDVKSKAEEPPQRKEVEPSSMLSWKDGEKVCEEDQPKCAFDFTNSVMFDLDVD